MTAGERSKVGAVLLAAGGSARLGRPKQLVLFQGETLLRRTARSLADSVLHPVVIVLGAESSAAEAEVRGLAVKTVLNPEWGEGMSGSIRTGVQRLLGQEPGLHGILIALCDQPLVSTADYNRLASSFAETTAAVIASAYGGSIGVPAVFSSSFFDDLTRLRGDKGARSLIRQCDDVLHVPLPEARFDVDTIADLKALETHAARLRSENVDPG